MRPCQSALIWMQIREIQITGWPLMRCVENVTTARRPRGRALTMGEVGRRDLENSAPTRGETSWFLLQQKQQTRSMPQPTGNGNVPWKSAPTATYQEWLNSSRDVYHGLAFEETVSCPLPFAASLHFSLFRWVLHSVLGIRVTLAGPDHMAHRVMP